ncbi:MAG: EFR1 family ferrodoxin [Gallicola sp.]|nr:EFR1 family ferrodoxin [Gallicola sp.]
MIGIYFSSTGNSKYCAEKFCGYYKPGSPVYSIEDPNIIEKIRDSQELLISYLVYFSSIPKIMQDFIFDHPKLWKRKKVYIIATMALFSGDGAGIMGRLLKEFGAEVVGGIHVKMPDNISDEKFFNRKDTEIKKVIARADEKIFNCVKDIFKGDGPQQGMGNLSFLAGFLGQRMFFGKKTKYYSDRLKINASRCIGCGKCVSLCPTKNIYLKDKKAMSQNRCTYCYRCVNHCPSQAITLLGKEVFKQYYIDQYLSLAEDRV